MNRSDSPYLADWYVVSLRWIVLMGATVSLSTAQALYAPGSLILLGLATWNIALTWVAGQSRRLIHHREICTLVDLAAAGLFFILDGGLLGPAAWFVVLPLIGASLYYNFTGGLLAAVLLSIIEASDIYIRGNNVLLGIGAVLATLLLGALFGILSQRAYNQLQNERKDQIARREKQQKVDTDRLRAIYNLTSTLTTTLSYERVLDAALDLSVSALHVEEVDPNSKTIPADSGFSSAVLLFRSDQLVVGSARRFTQADLRATFPAKQGILAKVIEAGEPLVTGNLLQDPELGRIIGFSQCNSVYCLPMRTGYNVYGIMIFGHQTDNYFSRERCEVLGIVCRQAVIAIQNARLYEDLANEKERMVEVQEEARKKLARDLHDGPTQSVAAIAMRVSLARRMMERNTKSAAEELEKIEDLARRTTKEIRHMLFTLRPLVLETQGLIAALHANADKLKETYNQQVSIQVDEKFASEIEMGKSGVIFYIVDEALNNARKHARATQIWVRLNPLPKHPEIALLEVIDNGTGFDLEEVNKSYDKRGSLGMINLRERSELVNGVLNIQTAPGKGTRIQVYIPITEDAADVLNNAQKNQVSQTVR
ncbi:MAG TPA: histidine kinase [Anaerolineales bacterium]|jgi:signal transduction histidine kinase